jgi:excisionase family DNA binding protein
MEDFQLNQELRTQILIPYQQQLFWESIRKVVREEMISVSKTKPEPALYETPGLTYKPLYKIAEVCSIFHITKPTVYDWIRHGKLKPFKIRSRVYFLWQDIDQLLRPRQ